MYRFGVGFLLGKRVPRKGGGATGGNGASSLPFTWSRCCSLILGRGGKERGISAGVSEVRGGICGSRGRHRKGEGKGKERVGVLETVVEVPEEEEEGEGGEEERKKRRGGVVGHGLEGELENVELGRWG